MSAEKRVDNGHFKICRSVGQIIGHALKWDVPAQGLVISILLAMVSLPHNQMNKSHLVMLCVTSCSGGWLGFWVNLVLGYRSCWECHILASGTLAVIVLKMLQLQEGKMVENWIQIWMGKAVCSIFFLHSFKPSKHSQHIRGFSKQSAERISGKGSIGATVRVSERASACVRVCVSEWHGSVDVAWLHASWHC